MAHPYWPLFDLRVRTPTLELRYPNDDDVIELVALAVRGIHDPADMPFGMPWTDAPPGEFERNCCQFLWRQRAELTAKSWHLPMVVALDAELIGSQGLAATEFVARRTVETGSWLGRAFQGQGFGKEMRQAILHLGFAGLGAERAVTGAWHDNGPSLGVTRALGYRANGESIEMRRDAADRQLHYAMDRVDWESRRRDDIEIEGLQPCLPLLGLDSA